MGNGSISCHWKPNPLFPETTAIALSLKRRNRETVGIENRVVVFRIMEKKRKDSEVLTKRNRE